MSVFHENMLIGSSGQGGAAAAYTIPRSLRFNSTDSAFLSQGTSRTPVANTSITFSFWLKLSNLSADQQIIWSGPAAGYLTIAYYGSYQSGALWATNDAAGLDGNAAKSNGVLRDPSAWYHILYSRAHGSNGILYINGVQQTTQAINTANIDFFASSAKAIGRRSDNNTRHASFYLADFYCVDGQALTPSSFGETDATTGAWNPKAYTGTYPGNSFHLDFADNSAATAAALGKDTSGNNNNWTPNNLSVDLGGNTSQNWSATASIAGQAGFEATKAFDGDSSSSSSSYYFPGTNGIGTFTFAQSIPYSTIKIWYGRNNGRLFVNGVDMAIGSTGYAEINQTYLASKGVASPLVSIGLERISAGNGAYLFGVEVNGSQLIDPVYSSGNDSLVDTPTSYGTSTGVGGEVRGNYCTWNAVDTLNSPILSNGNLDATLATFASSTASTAKGTIALAGSGKYYWEVTYNTANGLAGASIGIIGAADYVKSVYDESGTYIHYWSYNGTKWVNSPSNTSYGASYGAGDVIGVALNLDSGTVTFYKNNVSQGAITLTTSASGWKPMIANATTAGTQLLTLNAGQRAFAYSAPSGFSPLVDTLLPTPTIANGATAMDVKLYTGNGSTQTISGLNFSPDWVWIKARNLGYWHRLIDSVRGAQKFLYSNDNSGEGTSTANDIFTSFDSTGFTLGGAAPSADGLNQNAHPYVAWCWDAGANSSKTYTVTVVSGAFYIDGKQQPTLNLEEGSTYTFDLSAASNSGHPFRLSESANGPTQYTTGVTTSGTAGNAGATLTIAVASGAPTLYYFCTNHSGMGGQINTNTTAGASNFAGTITSTVRANISAGFSVVTYTGTGSNATVGHGLGVAPQWVIVKRRNTTGDWATWHTSIANTNYLLLNSTAASTSGATYWNSTSPTSSLFSVGTNTNTNANTGTYVAYAWAPVAGYSSFGSYTGNGSSNGPMVHLNFRPAVVMVKMSSSTGNWTILDDKREGYNVDNDPLHPNLSDGEGTTDLIDITSNGFKVRTTNATFNTNAGTYVYAAWASAPFPYARAR